MDAEDEAISRHHDSMHSDEDALDAPDECGCGEPLRFGDDGLCAECREADDRATYARDVAEMEAAE